MHYGRLAGALLASTLVLGARAAAQQAPAPGSTQPAAAAAPSPLRAGAPAVARGAARHSSRMHAYVHDLLGPGAWIGVGVGAGIEQAQTSPQQWGTGASGFGKRAASNAGQLFAQETVRHGLAAVMDRSTDYQRCSCRDFGGRVGNAFVETFTDRDAEGHRGFSVPRIAGAIAGSFAPLLWWPGATVKGAETAAGTSLLLTVGGNLITEFVHLPW